MRSTLFLLFTNWVLHDPPFQRRPAIPRGALHLAARPQAVRPRGGRA
jgi:hypothetical protein